MKKSMGILAVIAAAGAALVLAGSAFAQDGGVSVSDGHLDAGDTGTVTVDVSDVGGEGLGAWTIDVSFDSNLIATTDCTAELGGVCNENYTANSARITGASAGGASGDISLGSITFECLPVPTNPIADPAVQASDLTLSVSVFADATVGEPQDLSPSISNGTFTCSGDGMDSDDNDDVVLPPTGTGFSSGSSSSLNWFIALFAAIGVLGLGTSYAVVLARH